MINEHKKGVKAPKYTKKAKGIEPPKPRNPVAKNATSAIGGGAAGAHKDKKKAAKAGEVKHKKLELAESYDRKLELMLELSVLQQKIAEARKSGADKWRQHFDKETASTRERYNKSKEHYDRLKKDPEYREQEFQKWHQEVHGKKAVAEGSNDGKEDNFTIDDIKNLEKIRDFETLKAHAKELIKGKPARRMKPEKISWFYNHIDTLKNPLAVIKMMYDLMLAGEGHKVIGSRNSMSSNSYRTKFGEQGVAEGWTHDSLAAELFEMPTYENRLREMLEGQVSFLEGGTEERVTMASKKPGSQHHLNDADQGNIDDMHLRSVHPSDKGDKDEYGMEGEYLRNELHTIMRVCKHLEHSIDDSEDLPTWVIDKMSQAKGMIVMVMDYLISEKEETLDKQSGKEDHMMK